MRKILLILATLFSFAASAQTFPDTDSLKRYNDQYIRNSAITAFTNNRLNTLLKGIIEQLGSGGGGGSANQIVLRNNGSFIQWKYANQSDFFWINLISISSITGAQGIPGIPGPSIEMQKGESYIQYRPVGTSTWINLIAISDITGPPGSGGGGGGSSAWGSITGTIASQLDLQAAFATKQPIGQVFFTGLATDLSTITVPNTFPLLQTSGYSVAGRGGALYIRTATTGATRFRFQSQDGQWWTLADQRISPRMFGAIGDSTDATAAMQAALDYTRAGTEFRKGTGTPIDMSEGGMYLISKITMHSGNLITDSRVNSMGGFNYSNGNGAALIYINGSLPADSFMIVTDMNAAGWGINGLQIVGGSVGNTTSQQGGIHVYSGVGGNANNWRLTNNLIKGWGIEAVWGGGSPFTVSHNLIQGLNNRDYINTRTLTGGLTRETGAGRFYGVDGSFDHNEFTGAANQNPGSAFAISGSNMNCGAAHFGALNVSKMTNNIYQVGDVGLRATGGENIFTSERFDTNAGHGIMITGGGADCIFNSCQIIRNSLAGVNLYDGVYNVDGIRLKFLSPQFGAGAIYGGVTYQMRYFINDQKTLLNQTDANSYDFIRFYGQPGTDFVNYNQASAEWGPKFTMDNAGLTRISDNSATPPVFGKRLVRMFNTATDTVTNFLKGLPGQQLYIIGDGANGGVTTLKHTSSGTGIRLGSGNYATLSMTVPVELINIGTYSAPVWLQTNGASAGEGAYQPLNTFLSQISGLSPVNGATLVYDNGWKTYNDAQFRLAFQVPSKQQLADTAAVLRGLIGSGGGGSGVTDGDKGDITISGTGTVYTVDAGVINDGKIATGVSATKIGANTNVSNAEYGYLDGVTSSIQTQIGGKLNTPSGNGIVAHTGSGVATARTITPANAEVIVNNGDAVAGNPVISLAASIARQQTLIDTAAQIRAYLDTASSVLPISYYPELTDSFPTIGGMVRKVRDSVAALYTTKANLASPTFTGTPQSVTFATTDSTDKIATTKYVRQVAAGISSGGSAGVVASVADINTGTDNIEYTTPLGLQGSKYTDQSNSKLYGTTAGTGTVYTLTLSPVPAAQQAGMVIYAKFHLANTGAATLNVNGLGALAIVKEVSTALVSGDIPINKYVTLVHNGTQWQIISPFSDVLKANLASPTFTGTATIPTATITTATAGTLQGSTSASGSLTMQSTSNGTKGRIILNSNLGTSITTVFGAQTLTYSYNVYVCSASANYTVTLPAAGAATGVVYHIKKAGDAFTITIQANGAETIDGSNTQAISTAYQYYSLVSNGTNWYKIGGN